MYSGCEISYRAITLFALFRNQLNQWTTEKSDYHFIYYLSPHQIIFTPEFELISGNDVRLSELLSSLTVFPSQVSDVRSFPVSLPTGWPVPCNHW